MGCSASKQKVCQNCQESFSPTHPRRESMHVHHFPENKLDSYHLVSLTSTTYGSLGVDQFHTNHYILDEAKSKDEFFHLDEAKTWSKWLEKKIPKVPPKVRIQAPPGEPETINSWELMEGLEDTSNLGSFSLNVLLNSKNSNFHDDPITPSVLEVSDNENESHLHSDSAAIIPESDRKALEEHPPTNYGIVGDYKFVADEKEKLVLYFTSLRVVRKTYEDCCDVRAILKGLGVKVDEKDVSMHSGFKDELKELLGEGYPRGFLPKLFIGMEFLGGADEIGGMNEAGQLENLVERCEKLDIESTLGGGNGGVCEACGDIRFIPCDTCSGSCKIFCDDDFDEEYGFQRCPDCNENGLIRCPVCCE